MNPQNSPTPAPTLSYAKPSRFRIDIHLGPTARVTVPTPGMLIILGSITIPIIALAIRIHAKASEGLPFTRDLTILAAIIVIFLRLSRRIFVVDHTHVRAGYLFLGREIWIETWPRQSVGEIRYSTINKKLIIRITGRDMHEYHLPGDADAKQEIASTLQSALTETLPA